MKTLLTPTSHQQDDSGTPAAKGRDDWKQQFRLNALDLNPLLQDQGDSFAWASQEPCLQRTLDLVRHEIVELNVLIEGAGEPALASDNVSLLLMLGLADLGRPASATEKLKFAWRLLMAVLKFHHRAAVLRATHRSTLSAAMST